MGYLETMGSAVGGPLTGFSVEFAKVIPKVFITAVVVLFGYLLGWLLGNAIKHVLHKMKFDDKFKKLHLAKPLENIHISGLVGWVVKWYTFVIFCAAGASYISLYPVTNIINTFAQWFPNLIIAMTIGLLGAMAAEYVHKMVLHVSMANVKTLANIAKYFILTVVIILALDQIIDISVLENVMLIIFAGISLGVAVAIGVSFGLAFKDEAANWVNSVKKK